MWWLAANNNPWPMKNNCFSCSRGESSKVTSYIIVYISQRKHAKPTDGKSRAITPVMQPVQTKHRCDPLCLFEKFFTISGKGRRNLL